MSWRNDLVEAKCAFSTFVDQVGHAQTGGHQEDVVAALQLLIGDIGEAAKSVAIAEERHRIDQAEHDRKRAEDRLAELQS